MLVWIGIVRVAVRLDEEDSTSATGDDVRHAAVVLDAVAGDKCQGAQTLAVIRRLAATRSIERKLVFENAKRLFRLKT